MNNETTLEKLKVLIEAYTKPYMEEMEKIKKQTKATTSQVEKQTSKIKNAFAKIGKTVGVALGIAAIISFGKSCIQLGSDLEEVQNVVDVSFGDMSGSVDAFAKNAIEKFGLSELSAKKYMGTYGAMAKAFQFSTEQAYEMSAAITGLTGDVASFYNLSTDEAYTKLKSIFTGETETLKELGVVMTQTALDQYAMNNGFGKTTSQMTEQEKVMLRYQFVMSQLSDASGDFARTSNSWANQTRVLSLRFEQLKATIGQGLINAFTPVIRVINTVIARLQVLADYFKAITTAIFSNAGSGTGGIGSEFGKAASSAGGIANSMKNAAGNAKEVKKALMGFDELNILSENKSGAGGTSDAGGSLGGLGTVSTEGLVDTSGMESVVSKVTAILEPLRKISLEPLATAFERLKEAASPLGRNLFDGLEWAYYNIFVPLASWTIEDLLPAFLDLLSGALKVLNSVLEALQPLALWLWDSFLEPIASWTGGIIVSALEGLANALTGISDWISNNQGLVEWIVTLALSFFATSGLGGLLAKVIPLIVSFGASAFNVITSIKSVAGALSLVKFVFSSLVSALGGPVMIAIAGVIALGVLLWKNWDTVSAKAKEVWSAVQAKFREFDLFLTAVFSVDWSRCFGSFGDILNGFLVNVRNIWNSVKQIFDGIVIFIKGVFTGNWRMAWEGVKQIFAGIMNGLEAVVKSPLNAVISLVNAAISGLNRISIDIPSWVPKYGGRTFGIDIPKIPYLATGGVVKRATLAAIGENGAEAVMPLERNTGWIRQLAGQINAYNGGGITKEELYDAMYKVMEIMFSRYMHFYIGDEDIARHANRGNASLNRRYSPKKA